VTVLNFVYKKTTQSLIVDKGKSKFLGAFPRPGKKNFLFLKTRISRRVNNT